MHIPLTQQFHNFIWYFIPYEYTLKYVKISLSPQLFLAALLATVLGLETNDQQEETDKNKSWHNHTMEHYAAIKKNEDNFPFFL